MKLTIALAAFFSFIAAAGLTVAQNGTPQGNLSPLQHIQSAGLERSFVYYTPLKLDASQGAVFFFHGGGGNATNAATGSTHSLWQLMADAHNVLVVFPNGQPYPKQPTKATWNTCLDCSADEAGSTTCPLGDDVQFFRDLLPWLTTNVNASLNLKRIYAAGESVGALMTMRLAVEANDALAAGASFAGNLPVGNDNSGTNKCSGYDAPYAAGQAVPMLLFKGDADPRIPFGGTDGADHQQYCLAHDSNPQPPCDFGAVYSSYDTFAFWEWKHSLSSKPSRRVHARSTVRYQDTVPDCNDDLSSCDGSYVIRHDIGPVPSVVVVERVVGGGHAFPQPGPQTQNSFNANGWANRDKLGGGYAAEEAWAFFSSFSR